MIFDLELVCTPGLIWNLLLLFPLFFRLNGTGTHDDQVIMSIAVYAASYSAFLDVIYT